MKTVNSAPLKGLMTDRHSMNNKNRLSLIVDINVNEAFPPQKLQDYTIMKNISVHNIFFFIFIFGKKSLSINLSVLHSIQEGKISTSGTVKFTRVTI